MKRANSAAGYLHRLHKRRRSPLPRPSAPYPGSGKQETDVAFHLPSISGLATSAIRHSGSQGLSLTDIGLLRVVLSETESIGACRPKHVSRLVKPGDALWRFGAT